MPKNNSRKKKSTKSAPLWKKKQTQKKNQRFSKLFNKLSKLISWAVVIFLIGFIIWLNRTGLWKDNEHYNLVYASQEGSSVGFISLDPVNQELIIFKLPSTSIVTAVYGYGDYKVDSLLRLGKIENLGTKLLQKSIQELFGLVAHSIVIYDYPESKVGDNDWINKLTQMTTWHGIKGKIPLKDAIRFSSEIKAIRPDKIDVIEVGDSRLA